MDSGFRFRVVGSRAFGLLGFMDRLSVIEVPGSDPAWGCGL